NRRRPGPRRVSWPGNPTRRSIEQSQRKPPCGSIVFGQPDILSLHRRKSQSDDGGHARRTAAIYSFSRAATALLGGLFGQCFFNGLGQLLRLRSHFGAVVGDHLPVAADEELLEMP